jgi:uncharacterized protein YbaR (Trm112 family)
VAVDAELLAILACPNCRGEVEHKESEQVIECRRCHYRYALREGIPVMLVDEAEKPSPAGQPAAEER